MPDPRDAVLDRFSDATDRPPPPANMPTLREATGISERVIGAQVVAVKRNEANIRLKLKELAAMAGENWFYRFPVKNKKEQRTDYIDGPSIKLANDLARTWGNCDVDCRVIDIGDAWQIHARFTDFETGFTMTRPFMQSKGGSKLGGADDSRRLEIAMAIGTSKAIRNIIVNALQTYADEAFEEAKDSLVTRIGKDRDKWINKVALRLEEINIDPKRVERVVGRVSKEWLNSDIARVIAMVKSVQDGFATLDETFPPLENEVPTKAAAPDKLSEFAKDQPAPELQRPIEQPKAQSPHARGRADRDANKALRACPPEWRDGDHADELDQWESGWRLRDDEITAASKKEK